MSTRPDISDKLTHFTKGNDDIEAFERLKSIVTERRINGNNVNIKGAHTCICFTEAPLTSLSSGLVNPSAYSRYSPFGVLFEKRWAFDLGGRPVIYQPDSEYPLLADEMKWRHVRYEPPAVDFTWEREWRIQSDSIEFTPEVATLVVPTNEWAEKLIDEHIQEQDYQVLMYNQVIDELLAEQYREEFSWRIYVLA